MNDCYILSFDPQVEKCDDELGIGHDTVGMAKRKRHQMDMIDCEDANGNTPLSEAAGKMKNVTHPERITVKPLV